MPDETLPASSEVVPVGAIEVRQPLRRPFAAMSGARLLVQDSQVRPLQHGRVVERERALLAAPARPRPDRPRA